MQAYLLVYVLPVATVDQTNTRVDVLEHLLAPAFHVQTVLQTHGYRGVAALSRVLACHVSPVDQTNT